ncbi:MAG: LamG domain-containing protein, partial [archaeon]|nr:LamG domain-containing protein [archaeon]
MKKMSKIVMLSAVVILSLIFTLPLNNEQHIDSSSNTLLTNNKLFSSAIPESPVLDAIPNPDYDGSYNITCSEVYNATGYELYRNTSTITDISSLTPIYELNLTNHYDGIVTFYDTQIGSIDPFIDILGTQHQAYTGVIDEYLGRKKVLEFDFVSSGTDEYVEYNFTQPSPTSGNQSIEFSTILGDFISDGATAYSIHGETFGTEFFYLGYTGGSSHEWYLRSGGTSWQIMDITDTGNEQYGDSSKWIDIKITSDYDSEEVRVYFNGNEVFSISFSSMPNWDNTCTMDVIDIGCSWGDIETTYLDSLSWSWHPHYYQNISSTLFYEVNNTGHYKGSETFRNYNSGDDPYPIWEDFDDGYAQIEDFEGTNGEHKNIYALYPSGSGDIYVSRMFDIIDSPTSGTQVFELWANIEYFMYRDYGCGVFFQLEDSSGDFISVDWSEHERGWEIRTDDVPRQTALDMDNDNIENLEWMQIKFEVDYDNDEVTFYVGESENLNDLGTLPMSLGAIDKFVCRVGWEPAPNTFEVRIDSLSWSWDPVYELGDLLKVDSSFELNYTEQNIPNGDYYYVVVATNELGSS